MNSNECCGIQTRSSNTYTTLSSIIVTINRVLIKFYYRLTLACYDKLITLKCNYDTFTLVEIVEVILKCILGMYVAPRS